MFIYAIDYSLLNTGYRHVCLAEQKLFKSRHHWLGHGGLVQGDGFVLLQPVLQVVPFSFVRLQLFL